MLDSNSKAAHSKLIDWREAEALARTLAEKVKASTKKFEGIIAVAKGGLIPAYFLSRDLGIDKIELVCTNHYDSGRNRLPQPKLILPPKPDPKHNYRNWLIVEDVVETGETIQLLRKHFPHTAVACLVRKTDFPVRFFARQERDWVRFAWELS